MRNIVLTIAAALVAVTSTVATAQPRHDQRGPHHAQPHRPHHATPMRPGVRSHQAAPQRWQRGQRLESRYRSARVSDWRRHQLRAPARGQHWVRAGDQFLLITAAGLIAAIAVAR